MKGTLNQIHDRLTRTLESMTDGFVLLTRDWHYVYVNKRAAEMFGRNAEDLIGKHIWTEFPEGIGQPFYHNYHRALNEQVPIKMEEYYPPWNRWFENRIYPSEEGLSIFFQDITEQKRAQSLSNGQQRLHEMIATGRSLPETLTALAQFIEAQAPGMLCSILLLDEDGIHVRHGAAPSLPADFVAAIDGAPIGPRAGSCGTAAFRGATVFVEDIQSDPLWDDYRHLAAPHQLRACWSTPIFDDERRVLGTFAIYYRHPGMPDPFHLQLIEIATHIASICISRSRDDVILRRHEQELRLIYDTVSDVIFLVEVKPQERYRFLSANQAFLSATGLSADQVHGKAVEEVVPPASHDLVFSNYRKAIQEKRSVQWEEVSEFPSGKRTAIVRVSPVFNEQGICTNLVGAVHDVTEFRNAEMAVRKLQEQVFHAQKMELIGGLAAGVAHQLNTPLAVIMMRLQMMKDDLQAVSDGAILSQLDVTMNSAKKMSVIIQDLLNFSRVPKLQKETVQVESVLRQILKFVDVRARKQHVELRQEFQDDLPPIEADRNRLEQAFLNIIVNALDEMPGGGLLMMQSERIKRDGANFVRIEFRDNGPGMTPETAARIFDPFFTTKPPGQGTGLGLAVTREIVKGHGGEIRVRSKKGEGSTFEIFLPLPAGT